MKFNTYKAVFGVLLAAGLACAPMSATPVGAGSFSISGDVYVTTAGGLLFGLDNNIPPTSQTAAVIPPSSGFYSGMSFPEVVGIKNIASTAANGDITIAQWLTLPTTFGFVDLSNVAVAPPTTPVCSAANDVVGSASCVAAPGQHILLSEGPNDVNGNPTVFASLTVSGTAYTGSSSTGVSQLMGSISETIPGTTVTGLLATFQAQGYFNTPFSGHFLVSTVPEPGTFAALGLGMLVLGSLRKRIRGRKSE